MTGTLGFHGHLSAAEILNQIFEIDALAVADGRQPITNIVYMG
jgi:adenine C2-methylase RlmN of 23S rRNA A2503 and tRNA A37